MTSCATSTPTTLSCPSLLRPQPPLHSAFLPSSPFRRTLVSQRGFSCQVALSNDVPVSIAEEEAAVLGKIGKKVRVNGPRRVYHVMKIPDLDLGGLEGTIKQYVAIWKGKRISANLPFKVEFFIKIDGQEKPVKVLAHLREDEFEYVDV